MKRFSEMIAMRFVPRFLSTGVLAAGLAQVALAQVAFVQPAQARTWTDTTGNYTVDGDLFAFNDEHVIVQREDGEMAMFKADVLSDDDKSYLLTESAAALSQANLNKEQTWTMKDGYRLVGKIVDYSKSTVTLQRRRGKSWVNDRQYSSLPPVYQAILRKSLEHLEGLEDVDDRKVDTWMVKQKGLPREFEIEGVVIELKDGNEYIVPFFLFSDQSLAILKGGWDEWLAAHTETDHDARDDEAFRLQSTAAAMQNERAIDRQIAIANLGMNAINAGVTSLWEVTLYPADGNLASPGWVVVPGRNSEQAKFNALQQYPGFVAGPIRKVSRRR